MTRSRPAWLAPIALLAASAVLVEGCGLVAGAAPSPTQSTAATLAAARSQPGYFGVNFDYHTVAEYANDLHRDAQLAALDPGTIRYPGGTEADSFQWQEGVPGQTTNDYHFTLQQLDDAWQQTGPTPQTRAVPMFDLNVVTRQLPDQVAMLKQAQSMGMPVRYVELGNELYSKPAWFSDGTVYAEKVVVPYVQALHCAFPGVQVGADGWLGHLGQTSTPAQNTWNHDMLTYAAQHGQLPDAVILHAYPDPPPGNLTAGDLPTLFERAYQEEDQLLRPVIGALPSPAPLAVWLTEYNLHPGRTGLRNPPEKTYGHALFVAEYALTLTRTPRATLSDLWSAFGGPEYGAWGGSSTAPVLSPQGLALQWIAEAARDAASIAPILFSGGPTLPDGGPALVGCAFSTGGARRAVLVNLTGHAVIVRSGAALPAGAPFENVTGQPTQPVAAASQLTYGRGSVGATITLPPYSITYIR